MCTPDIVKHPVPILYQHPSSFHDQQRDILLLRSRRASSHSGSDDSQPTTNVRHTWLFVFGSSRGHPPLRVNRHLVTAPTIMPSATTTTTTTAPTATTTPSQKSHQSSVKPQNSHQSTARNGANGLINIEPTTYARWRPSYHLIAPQGWLNDPCAPGYTPSTGRYHVGFQWNPKGAEWGDIVWGKAFSSDLVTWDVLEEPSLKTDAPYDHAGVFTGCWRPTGPGGRHEKKADGQSSSPGEVTFIYTSVSRLPIHYTKEYHRGCETLSLATSQDGGKTWVKDQRNPILPGPPEGIDALGWRDPYVADWPVMAKLVSSQEANGGGAQQEKKHLFGLISGGIRNKTPTTWLYKIDAQDLTSWEFVGPVVKPGMNYSPSRWTGDIGVNWEVTNFVSLADGRTSQDFLVFGAEGCKAPYGGAGCVPGTKRTNRAQLWIAIDPANDAEGTAPRSQDQASSIAGVSSPEQKPLMNMSYGGIFDHGLYYAANGFWDPVTQQQIVIGWVTEEDIPVASQMKQGWSGCLSLPRVASLVTIPHVVRASRSALQDITSIRVTQDNTTTNESFTVQTLGIKPDPRLHKLRAGASASALAGTAPRILGSGVDTRLPLKTAQWEAYAHFAKVGSSRCGRVGIKIRHATTTTTTTTTTAPPVTTVLYYAPEEESFVIERPDIYFEDQAKAKEEEWSPQLQQEVAPFTLFTSRDAQTGVVEEERLRVHVLYDGSVVEVFVNERVAITTRIYLQDQKCSGLEFFAETSPSRSSGEAAGGAHGCVLEQAAVWDGLSA